VVDDQPHVLKFIEIDLKLHGFEVVTTTSGKKALELVKSVNPDIMLLDMIMPDMDGCEVLRNLRVFTLLPVIVFSASHESHNDAISCGASDFMDKPFRSEDMVRRIETLLTFETG